MGNVPIVVDAQERHPPRLPEAPQVDAHARGALPRLVGHHLYALAIHSPEPAALALERVGVLLPRVHRVQRERDGALANLHRAHAVVFVEAEPVVPASPPMVRHAREQDFGAVSNIGSLRGRRQIRSRLGGRGAAHRWSAFAIWCYGTPPRAAAAAPGWAASSCNPHALAPRRGSQMALSRRVACQRDGSASFAATRTSHRFAASQTFEFTRPRRITERDSTSKRPATVSTRNAAKKTPRHRRAAEIDSQARGVRPVPSA